MILYMFHGYLVHMLLYIFHYVSFTSYLLYISFNIYRVYGDLFCIVMCNDAGLRHSTCSSSLFGIWCSYFIAKTRLHA